VHELVIIETGHIDSRFKHEEGFLVHLRAFKSTYIGLLDVAYACRHAQLNMHFV